MRPFCDLLCVEAESCSPLYSVCMLGSASPLWLQTSLSHANTHTWWIVFIILLCQDQSIVGLAQVCRVDWVSMATYTCWKKHMELSVQQPHTQWKTAPEQAEQEQYGWRVLPLGPSGLLTYGSAHKESPTLECSSSLLFSWTDGCITEIINWQPRASFLWPQSILQHMSPVTLRLCRIWKKTSYRILIYHED